MPWCDSCNEYRAPTALTPEGTCTACGEPVDTKTEDMRHQPTAKAPWHFWLMLVALVLYLGWRLVQFVIWGIGNI